MLVAICSISLFAAGQNEGQAEQEKIELRFAWWTNQVRTQRTLKVIKMYEDLNPNVKIIPEYQGWGQYWDKLSAQIAANDMPDIIQQDLIYLTQYTDKGLLTPLDGLEGINLETADAAAIDLGKIDGNLMGVTVGTNAIGVVYDAEMFQKAGVPVPDVNWTWKDYEEKAMKIHEELGIYGSDFFEIENLFPFLVREYGKTFFSKDGMSLGYDDDSILIDFLDMLKRLQDAGAMPGVDYWLEVKANEPSQYYALNKAAMGFVWTPKASQIFETKQKISDHMIIPGPNNDKGMYVKPGMFLSLTSTSKHKEEAAKFISYFITDIEATKVLSAGRGIPVTAAGRKAVSDSMDDQAKKIFEYIGLVSENSSPLDPPYPAGYGEVRDLLESLCAEALFGKITTTEAATRFRTEAEAILSR